MLKQEKNVLLLIANQRVSALTAKLLAVHGFACTPATTFTQALTFVGNRTAQVALVDFGAEPDDGCRFAAEAKKLAANLCVIVCDAEPSVERAQRVRKSDAFDYLCCPFVVPDLVGCIRRATAVLGSMRKPYAALDAYLEARGVKPEAASASPAQAAPTAAAPTAADAAASAASSPASARPVLGVRRPVPAAETPSAVAPDDAAQRAHRERELLATLRTRGLLSEDLEGKAAEKLAQEASAPNGIVSAMAALELVSEEAWERAAEWIASSGKAPPVDFGVFPPDEKLVRQVEASVLRAYLAVPFAKLENVLLVALPHPDAAARAALEKAVGGPCQFFTCSGLAAKSVIERALAPKKEDATA